MRCSFQKPLMNLSLAKKMILTQKNKTVPNSGIVVLTNRTEENLNDSQVNTLVFSLSPKGTRLFQSVHTQQLL